VSSFEFRLGENSSAEVKEYLLSPAGLIAFFPFPTPGVKGGFPPFFWSTRARRTSFFRGFPSPLGLAS